MSRKPLHTPESRAKEATEKIDKAVEGLSFGQLAGIEKALIAYFVAAKPNRPKQKTPATA